MPPRMRARAESSGRVSVVGTKGLKVGLGGVDVAMMTRLPLAQALFQLARECISGGDQVAVVRYLDEFWSWRDGVYLWRVNLRAVDRR